MMNASDSIPCFSDRRSWYLMGLARPACLLVTAAAFACVLTGCQSSKPAAPADPYFPPSPMAPPASFEVPDSFRSTPTNAVATNSVSINSSGNSAPGNRILIIDPSSMPIAAGKATLTIGMLKRADGVYTGVYKVRVFPYFLKNENGRLAIIVSDESLAKINHGEVAAIIGTAITTGENSRSRHIDATATPINIDHGMLKLWFMAGDRKMIFEPAYHFADKRLVAARAQVPQS